jgi:hypothetical protein
MGLTVCSLPSPDETRLHPCEVHYIVLHTDLSPTTQASQNSKQGSRLKKPHLRGKRKGGNVEENRRKRKANKKVGTNRV